MTENKKGYKVTMVYADSPTEWNCSQWRNLTPSNALNRDEDWFCQLIHISGFLDYLNPAIQDKIMPTDIIIIQRNVVDQNAWRAMDYWQGMGKPVAIDLDDSYPTLPWSNPAHRFWIEKEGEWEGEMIKGAALKYLEEGLRRCRSLISPNRNILNDWSYVTNGYYLRNYAETDWWTAPITRAELQESRGISDRIVIGWGGSVSHYDSWWGSGIFEAATRISERFPKVLWMICGNDRRIYEHLPVPERCKKIQYGVPPEHWPKIVKTFDIGVAPLFGPYDQRRSWLKAIEYSLAEVPWVGTNGPVYGDAYDTGILVDNGPDTWEAAIASVIENLDKHQEQMSARIDEFRERFLIDNNIDAYHDVVTRIIANFNNTHHIYALPGVVKVNGQSKSAGETALTGDASTEFEQSKSNVEQVTEGA